MEPDDSHGFVAATMKHNNVAFTKICNHIIYNTKFKVQCLQALWATTPPPHLLTGDFNALHPDSDSVKIPQDESICLMGLAMQDKQYSTVAAERPFEAGLLIDSIQL